MPQKDNSTFAAKAMLRREALKRIADPVVLEAYGGYGKLFTACYSHLETGVACEKDEAKADFLALQRSTWAVYQTDIEQTICSIGRHLPINVLDVDPYGDPWPVVDGFLASFADGRTRPNRLALVVNDGLRQKIGMGGAWSTPSLQWAVGRFGNRLYDKYIDVCREMIKEKSGEVGYTLARFAGYYCGHNQQMTHYLAIVEAS